MIKEILKFVISCFICICATIGIVVYVFCFQENSCNDDTLALDRGLIPESCYTQNEISSLLQK